MCPACLASAALLLGSVMTAGGVTALTARVFRSKKWAKKSAKQCSSKIANKEK